MTKILKFGLWLVLAALLIIFFGNFRAARMLSVRRNAAIGTGEIGILVSSEKPVMPEANIAVGTAAILVAGALALMNGAQHTPRAGNIREAQPTSSSTTSTGGRVHTLSSAPTYSGIKPETWSSVAWNSVAWN